ncbi:hypothetical protein D3C84_806560 [compost metagenome]
MSCADSENKSTTFSASSSSAIDSNGTSAEGWLTWARNSMSETIRATRSSSSVHDTRTSLYSSVVRSRDNVTCALPMRLLIGVRSSCARSSENCDNCCTPASSRCSMKLMPCASSLSSCGIFTTDSRWSRSWVETIAATLRNSRIGASPRCTAPQALRPMKISSNGKAISVERR